MGNSESNQNAISHGLRIIKIFKDSPASKTDLCIYTDFVVDIADKPEGFKIDRDFYKYVIQNENQTIRIFVHNILTQKTRYIDLYLTRDWPNSDFLLGFKVRHESLVDAQKNIYRILDVFNPALKKLVIVKNFFFMAIEEFSYEDLNDLKAKLKLYQKCNIVFFDIATLNIMIVPFIYNPRSGLGFELGKGYLHDLQYIIQSLIKNRENMNNLQFKDEKTNQMVEMQHLRDQYKKQFQNHEEQKLGLSSQIERNNKPIINQNDQQILKTDQNENNDDTQKTQQTKNDQVKQMQNDQNIAEKQNQDQTQVQNQQAQDQKIQEQKSDEKIQKTEQKEEMKNVQDVDLIQSENQKQKDTEQDQNQEMQEQQNEKQEDRN